MKLLQVIDIKMSHLNLSVMTQNYFLLNALQSALIPPEMPSVQDLKPVLEYRFDCSDNL